MRHCPDQVGRRDPLSESGRGSDDLPSARARKSRGTRVYGYPKGRGPFPPGLANPRRSRPKAVEVTFSDALAACYARPIVCSSDLRCRRRPRKNSSPVFIGAASALTECGMCAAAAGIFPARLNCPSDLFAVGRGHPDLFPPGAPPARRRPTAPVRWGWPGPVWTCWLEKIPRILF